MLVFLDESGDTGRKINSGSSQYFVVSLVIFHDNDEALRCDRRIELLRNELNRPNFEFHFAENSRAIRGRFLEAVNSYNFSILTVAVDKDPERLYGEGFNIKESFYKYACHMVLTNASPYLERAKLIIDKSGSGTFQGELRKYLRNKLDDRNGAKIHSFKAQDSRKNNLLQLVDYCVGVSARKIQNKKDWESYYKYISSKELSLQIWPKNNR
jgi:hypothetical protein